MILFQLLAFSILFSFSLAHLCQGQKNVILTTKQIRLNQLCYRLLNCCSYLMFGIVYVCVWTCTQSMCNNLVSHLSSTTNAFICQYILTVLQFQLTKKKEFVSYCKIYVY